MNPFKSSLYWRLLVWFCVANLLVLLVGSFLTQRFIEYTTAVEINWAALAQDADHQYEQGGVQALAEWRSQQHHEGIEATLYEQGRALLPIRLPASLQPLVSESIEAGHDVVMQPRYGFYLSVTQVVGDDGHARQLVAMSRSHTRVRPRTRANILFGMQLVLSLLFIGLIGWWLARSVAKPVEALRNATRRMAAGELSTRVGRPRGSRNDELAQLAYDFDAMAERIEALAAHDRRVLQDLSHELRSPLARLQLILDLARSTPEAEKASYFSQAENEIARLDRMTGEMLALSRLEGGIAGIVCEPVDVVESVRECVEQANIEAQASDIQLEIMPTPHQHIFVLGSATLIERAVDNLIGNAIKFSPAGSAVEVSATTVAGFAELTVSDLGPGVPEAELASLFQPFFRGSNAVHADGHGLGLAIVQRVVKIHAGELSARNREGGGLVVTMRLPMTSGDPV